MTDPPQNHPSSATWLRARAEEQARHEEHNLAHLSPEQSQAVLHELQVHQIELEMQNEQLRSTQAELEQAREHYVELYDAAPVGYLTLGQDGLIRAANLTSVELLGVERSRLLGYALSRFVHREDQDAYYMCLRQAFSTTLVQGCELRLRPVSGEMFYARLELLQAEEEGTPVCHITLSNITEHRLAEHARHEHERRQAQAENEERLRLALDAGQLGAWDQDLRTGQVVCTPRACLMLGLTPGTPVRCDAMVERIHPEDRPGFLHAAEQAAVPGSSGRFETVFRLVLPDGAVRWLRLAARTFFEPSPPGQAVRRTGVLADITRQKETEAMLESRAEHLEQAVRERTARLQDAVAELEHFSYTLVHDLRAPLRTMAGFSELLLEQTPELGSTHRAYLRRTQVAAQRMDQLITDALNYNKLVRREFVLAPVDCGLLLQQMLETYPQFQQARAAITVAGPFPAVLGNAALLTQCFSNLLTNALKFMPADRAPRVRVSAEDRGARARLWVEDNGIGIAEEHREVVFKMFHRLNHQFEGTGIGLALVRKAAQRMRGEVGFESEPGQGTRFWVELEKAHG